MISVHTEEALEDFFKTTYRSFANSDLRTLGYTGDVLEPFDETKLKPGVPPEDVAGIQLIINQPKPAGVRIERDAKTTTGTVTKVFVVADRTLKSRSDAIDLVRNSTPASSRILDPSRFTGVEYPNTAYVVLTGGISDEEIFDIFGFPIPLAVKKTLAWMSTENDGEDIEVDVDNPLDLDFPDPKDTD